jgi:glycosyltransferase involved in cell wall biosynthesis
MRILNSTTLHGWSAGSWYAIQMMGGLARRGHKVHMLVPEGRTAETARAEGLNVITQPDLNHVNVTNAVPVLRKLRALRDEVIRPDLIVAHWGPDHTWWGILNSRSGPTIPLLRLRAHDPRPPARHPFARWLHRYRTQGVVVANEGQRRAYVKRTDMTPRRVHRVPPGFPLSEWTGGPDGAGVREICGVAEDGLLVASVARFAPQKDHETFFAAAARVAAAEQGVHFLVAGYPAERSSALIRQLAANYPVLDGRWTLWDERLPDGRKLVRAADIGVIHSVRSEAICRVALEYMAESIPLVCTSIGSLSEVVHEWRTGLVVQPSRADDLAGAIIRLVRTSDLRERLGRAGFERLAASFDPEDAVDRFEQIMNRYLAPSRAGSPRPAEPL